LVLVFGLSATVSHAEVKLEVGAASQTSIANGPYRAYLGSIELPAEGIWRVRSQPSSAVISELYLVPTEPSRLRQLGKRMYAALRERQTQAGRWQLQRGYEACRQFAQQGKGRGPKSIAELAKDKRWEYITQSWDRLHYRSGEISEYLDEPNPQGPFIHLIPQVQFDFQDPPAADAQSETASELNGRAQREVVRKTVPSAKRKVLAFQLRPFVDDGKHWVLYTSGECERVEIDPSLIRDQGVQIRPLVTKTQLKEADLPNLPYDVVVISKEPLDQFVEVTAYNQILDEQRSIRWDLSKSQTQPYQQLRDRIRQARRFGWRPYLLAGAGGVLSAWDASIEDARPADPRRTLSTFSVLGGRAAIEETLQLQNLNVMQSDETASIDIDSLVGVEVQSHPFEEMLGDQAGGRLELANLVPPDRFFVYVGKPETIPAFFDSGAPFIASMGTTLTGNCLDYNLVERYLARLGMNRDWLDAVLASGLTSELALFTPDLFLIDGTDVTVVARLAQPALLRPLLGMLGAAKIDRESILELPTASGDVAYLALRDDLLFAGTHRGELEKALALAGERGRGSLGESAEFRFMLTRLPVNEDTRLYAYLSDPFVRRLVGPRVKIGQQRRAVEKAKMEAVAARALLARLDGRSQAASLEMLTRGQYLPAQWQNETLSIDQRGLVRSEHYGTLPRMRTLPELPLEKITPAEAEAYRMYRENYSRYWRRYFDPIAIRLDEVGSDQLELSTFILPLVDNSIYNGLRAFLVHQDDQEALSVPIVEPTPVVQFSANLNDLAWQQVAGNFSEFFTRYSGASPAMLDDFGPGVHVAIFDADPIIAMGSGDVFGAFGGNVLRGNGSQMLMLPVALSMLTRPCSIMVETESPERTAQYLRQAALVGGLQDRQRRDFATSFYQVGERDEWVWTMDVFGVVKLRYGIEVVGKYLVIRNIPWSSDDHVVSLAPAEMNAAMLQANPSACQKQLPGLFAAATDANRQAVMSGMGRLYPFLLSGAESIEKAQAEHQRLFGFYPRQIGDDRWVWRDYRIVSEDYGEPTRQKQPAFDPEKPFGLMNRIDMIRLNMQFEDDGLRSAVRWRLR
jgi:hypothetical protein